jgi:hypothetical protein
VSTQQFLQQVDDVNAQTTPEPVDLTAVQKKARRDAFLARVAPKTQTATQ